MTQPAGPAPVVDAPPEKLRRLAQLRMMARAKAKVRAAAWRYDPVLWSDEVVRWPAGQHLVDYQRQTLADLVAFWREAVRGPHGLGKTTDNALAILWFATTRELLGIDWKVLTTAGGHRQLSEYLWPEVHKWARLLDWARLGMTPWREGIELLDMAIQLRHGQAFAAAAAKPELIEGAHADALLVIIDEAKAVQPATFDAVEGALAGATGVQGELPEAFALAASTPGEPAGRFYDIHQGHAGLADWHTTHVTVDQAVAAGRISQAWVDARRRQWERAAPQLWNNRVLGEFHSADENSVIPSAWLDLAVERWYEAQAAGWDQLGPLTDLGLDVAREGDDETVFAYRHGPVVWRLERQPFTPDLTVVADQGNTVLGGHGQARAVVDANGLGAGVYDMMRKVHGPRVEAFMAQAGTKRSDRSGQLKFTNTRSCAWWALRDTLDPAYGATLALPDEPTLLGDLRAPKWRELGKGLIAVESKADIKVRIGRSTDCGDGVVQAVWPAERRARMTHAGRVVGKGAAA